MKSQLLGATIATLAAVSLLGSATIADAVTQQAAAATPALTPTETAALQFMREEEKLARDVYNTLASKWNVSILRNISRSEQRHMDMVKVVLDRYDVADPAVGEPAGRFTNPKLQALYTRLVQQGSRSLASAMAVGVQIEKLDIADLRSRLAQVDASDIRFVFTQLSWASENHLRAFQRQL